MTAAQAVIETAGGAELEGTVTTEDFLDPPDLLATVLCRGELLALDSLGARLLPPVSYLRSGPEGEIRLPSLGLLPGDSVLGRSGISVEGVMSLPASSDVFGSSEDLTLRGGEGRGVLVVMGTLSLEAGTYFSGLALVGGDLVVENGATLQGMARVRGRLLLQEGGVLLGSACSAALALRAAVELRRPLRLLAGSRVHPM